MSPQGFRILAYALIGAFVDAASAAISAGVSAHTAVMALPGGPMLDFDDIAHDCRWPSQNVRASPGADAFSSQL